MNDQDRDMENGMGNLEILDEPEWLEVNEPLE